MLSYLVLSCWFSILQNLQPKYWRNNQSDWLVFKFLSKHIVVHTLKEQECTSESRKFFVSVSLEQMLRIFSQLITYLGFRSTFLSEMAFASGSFSNCFFRMYTRLEKFVRLFSTNKRFWAHLELKVAAE